MEEIKKILVEFCLENINDSNGWYNWCVDENNLPEGILLPDGNNYKKNINLKLQLHEKWLNEKDIYVRGELIEYYIVKWGGIKSNKTASLNYYKTSDAKELIERGIKGISSWSKALVLHNFNKYAIFDARVSCTINTLQKMSNNQNKFLFPILASRNNVIKLANSEIKIISKEENWNRISNKDFYNNYLILLNSVAEELNSDISTIEMLLFAKAEEVVKNSKLIKN